MKTRRRLGAGAAGLAALVLVVPTTAPARPRAEAPTPPPAGPAVRALAAGNPVAVDLAPVPPSTSPPPAPTNACPVAGPVAFVDSWGSARSGGRRHQGVDMLAAGGTPVVAPVAGTVTHRGNRVGGLSFHLAGDDGAYYYGTHLSGYGASGWVPAGTVVGYVGDSGNARGTPHLHFEIHPAGEGTPAVNPYPTVALLCRATGVATA